MSSTGGLLARAYAERTVSADTGYRSRASSSSCSSWGGCSSPCPSCSSATYYSPSCSISPVSSWSPKRHGSLHRTRSHTVHLHAAASAAHHGGGLFGANSNSQPLIAIDSKIEQAMELVKTHLMYAVREEVDVLRGKIADLETTLVQLEDENAILRKHVPGDLLGKLQM